MDIEEIIEGLKSCPESVRGYLRFLMEANRQKSELLEIAEITLAHAMRDDFAKAIKEGETTKTDEDKTEECDIIFK